MTKQEPPGQEHQGDPAETIAALQRRIAELEQERDDALHRCAKVEEDRQWMVDLLEQSNIPICFWHGPEHVFKYANTTYLFESGKLDAIGKPVREVYTEEEVGELFGVLDLAYQSGEVQLVPNALVRLENRNTGEMENRWFNLLYNPVRNKDLEIIGVSQFVIEVTEQVRAQQEIERNQRELKAAHEQLQIFKTLVETAPDAIGITSLEDARLTYVNPAYNRQFGYEKSAVGKSFLEVYDVPMEKINEIIEEAVKHGYWQGELPYKRVDGQKLIGNLSGMVLCDESGKPVVAAGIIHDMTAQKQAEAERLAFQERIIQAQRDALRELSAPLLPISDRVVVMPLIGTIDTRRSQQIMETLLQGVADYRADVVIVDITGVMVVDTQVANVLIQSAQAVRLLGAQIVLTGIGPSMAQTLVSLGADLRGIVTRASLQDSIAYAMAHTSHA